MSVDPVNIPTLSLEVDLDDSQGLWTLKRCMHASHATPAKFARMMGVSNSTISLWLSGKRTLSPSAIRSCYFCAAMSGVYVSLPNPARYLATAAKALKNPHVS
jgi:transcriptional regulator with XRE-family HTH domain